MKYKGVTIKFQLDKPFFSVPSLTFSSNNPFECLAKIRSLPADNLTLATPKIKGYRFEDCVKTYAATYFQSSAGVLLLNVNPMGKPASFWSNVPKEYRKEFLKDVVFLNCTSLDEVLSLKRSLPTGFCQSIGYFNGAIVYENHSD
jgi:hypothetical protein